MSEPSNVKTVVMLILKHCIELFICSKTNILTPSEPEETRADITILHNKSINAENNPIASLDGVMKRIKDAIDVPLRLMIKEFDLPAKSPILPNMIAPSGLAIIAIDIKK